MTSFVVVRDANGFAIAYGPADGSYVPSVPLGCTVDTEEDPNLTPPPLTPHEEEEIKRKLLAEAMVKRDVLLVHLERFRTRAIEANDTNARNALSTAITSLENSLKDPRVIAAIDGEVEQVLDTIKDEIGAALIAASPATYYALLALDAL